MKFLISKRICRSGSAAPLFIALTFGLSSCSTSQQSSPEAVYDPAVPPAPYVRIHRDSNLVQLQIASRRFVPVKGKGPSIWMTGVSHIGQSNYYVQLQQHLDARQLVLFEGISDGPNSSLMARKKASPPIEEQPQSEEKLSGLQLALAESLGLAFQLDSIDYSRDHFKNSDLSVQELRELMGKTDAAQSFESLMQMMEGTSWLDGLLQLALRALGRNPKLQGMSRLAMIEVLGQIEGDPARLQGLSPQLKQLLQILIQKRNDKVLSDLKNHLRRLRRNHSVSVFYGAGHMPDLETRLRRELKYRPAEEVWFAPFSVGVVEAGISKAEQNFIRSLVETQLKQFQP